MAFEQLDNGSIDPNVRIPESVRAAAAAAEAHYAKPADNSAVLPDATPPVHPGLAQPQPVPAAVAPPADPNPQPQPQPVPAVADDANVDWKARFLSMQGRWKASQQQLGITQQQAADIAVELQKTQELLARGGTVVPQTADHNPVIARPEDVETYGHELIDTVARTARAAVEPDLQRLRAENEELKKSATSNAQKELRASLAAAVPNWRAIQNDPRWKTFVSLPNIYTNTPRSQSLKAAWDAGNASQTIAIFREFVTELNATGQSVPGTPPATPPASHDPAMNLADLAAPGRARPAGGDVPNQSADKPVITRAYITQHYAKSRQGYYTGRQAEYDAAEAAIQAAQREGRIQG